MTLFYLILFALNLTFAVINAIDYAKGYCKGLNWIGMFMGFFGAAAVLNKITG